MTYYHFNDKKYARLLFYPCGFKTWIKMDKKQCEEFLCENDAFWIVGTLKTIFITYLSNSIQKY